MLTRHCSPPPSVCLGGFVEINSHPRVWCCVSLHHRVQIPSIVVRSYLFRRVKRLASLVDALWHIGSCAISGRSSNPPRPLRLSARARRSPYPPPTLRLRFHASEWSTEIRLGVYRRQWSLPHRPNGTSLSRHRGVRLVARGTITLNRCRRASAITPSQSPPANGAAPDKRLPQWIST